MLHLFLQLQSLIELRTVEREPQLTSTQLQFNNRHTKNEKTVLDSSLYLIPHTYKFTGWELKPCTELRISLHFKNVIYYWNRYNSVYVRWISIIQGTKSNCSKIMSLVVIQMWPNSPVWRTQYNGSYIGNNVLVSLKHSPQALITLHLTQDWMKWALSLS